MKRGDWIPWLLQFILGLLLGTLFASIFVGSRRGPPLVSAEHARLFCTGMALAGAAVISWFGDYLWLSLHGSVEASPAPYHRRGSRRASLAAGCLGCLILTLVALRMTGFLAA